ncbi:MAG: YigZ family protein [Candidatus Cloacimonadota bacterium]|nr:MAG: YigZ family protein [Candidatus Cloacimonadota bacterium]
MYLIKKAHSDILEEKKSKFISHLIFYKDFEESLKSLKLLHPKARHFVFAYRFLNKKEQIVEGFTDDGEPKNTSGKPTLSVLQGKNLINIAVITVRYFGGTKLGTGGLVRAYSDSCNMTIYDENLYLYQKLETFSFKTLYTYLSKVEYHLKEMEIKVKSKDFDATHCTFIFECTNEDWLNFQSVSDRMIEVLR